MVLEKLLALHTEERQRELLGRLQAETSRHFLEKSACDINDALTSILAVSEMEAPPIVPKIKKYIGRVNQALQSLRGYQSALRQKHSFFIHAVLHNALNVLEEYLKEKITVTRDILEIKANGEGDQSELEELLLYFFIQMAESGREEKTEFKVMLHQKNQEAVVTVEVKNPAAYSEKALADLRARAGGFKNRIQVNAQSETTQLFIKIPLIFLQVSKNTSSISVTINQLIPKGNLKSLHHASVGVA